MSEQPFDKERNGRDSKGRFVEGWKGGPGNPNLRRVHSFRNQLMATVTERDFGAVIKKLLAAAKKGEPWAVKELLDRLFGKASQALELTNPDGTLGMQALMGVVLETLDPYPEIKIAVAARLRAMANGSVPDAGGGT